MTEPTNSGVTGLRSTLEPRFRLSALMILILGVGLSLGVMSRVQVFSAAAQSFFGDSPLTRWLGVALAPIGIAIVMALVIQISNLRASREPWGKQAWPFFWRLTALALMVTLLVEESSLLRIASQWELNGPRGDGNPLVLWTRLRLLPTAGVLIMAGLVLGMRSRRARPPAVRSRVSTWFSVALVSMTGAVLVASVMTIPYLVLIAIEAVENAMLRPDERSGELLTNPPRPPMAPGLSDRLDGAMPVIGLALLAGLVAAGWLSSSLRRAAAGQGERRDDRGSLHELAVGLALTCAVLIAAAFLVGRTLPAVQPLALAGMGLTIGGWEFGVVALGFGCFSAGLVAHVLAPADDAAGSGTGRLTSSLSHHAAWLAKAATAALLSLVILASVAQIQGRYTPTGQALPWWLMNGLFEPRRARGAAVWNELQGNGWLGMLRYDASLWLPAFAIPWLGWQSLYLLASARGARPSPLDHMVDSAASARQFVGYWGALFALLVAALPTLAMTGLVILHHALAMILP